MKRQYSARSVLMTRVRAKYWLLTLLLSVSALAVPDHASAEPNTVEFNIPVQTVPAALSEFARQARVQLFFITDGFENIRANEVVGTFPRQEALQRLLEGTGLKANYTPDALIKVAPAEDSTSSAIRPSNGLALASADVSSDRMIAQAIDESRNVPASQGGAPVANNEENNKAIEQIVVTGSRIRGAQSASPVVTITRQEIDRAGFATVEEIVDRLPQNFGAGATQDTATDRNSLNNSVGGVRNNITSGSSVNLRGLGTSSTLILLNGRRMSTSGLRSNFTDISGIPVSAIERVEVLTDGASGIYGSDAIGGVVNFILRDNYEGAETRLRYGSDTGDDTSEVLFGQSFGKSWDGGNVLFSYEYYKHDSLANIDRGFASSQDLTRFGGTDWRLPSGGGNPANFFSFVDFQIYAIPAGQDGTSLTAADFDVNAPLNLNDIRTAEDLLPEQERHSVYVSATQDIGEAVELFAEARFSSRDAERRIDQDLQSFLITSANPFFVDPTDTGGTVGFILGYSLVDDIGPVVVGGGADAYGGTLGLTFDIGSAWKGELAANWGKEEGALTTSNVVDSAAFDAAVNGTTLETAFNPFGDGSNTNPAVLESFRVAKGLSGSAESELWTFSFNVDGTAFDLPGGGVQVATGIEYREESLFNEVTDRLPGGVFVSTPGNDASRDVLALYAEVFFPLVSANNSRLGLHRLELSLAARYEDYSDFGDSTDPKVGVVWSPTQALTLRGTYGTSFKAPSLVELDITNPTTNRWRYFPDVFVPPLPFPAIILLGGNENLKPEEATTWTAGFQWTPQSLDGLSLDVTYFNIDFENRIDSPFDDFLDPLTNPRFASLRNSSPTQADIEAIVNDPRYDPLSAQGIVTPAADLIAGFMDGSLPVGTILDGRTNNLAQSVVTGFELQLSYHFDTAVGLFDLGLNGNYLFDFERKLIDADPLVDEVDTLGRPVDLRARANLTWSREGWSVSGFVNYVDGYTDNVSDPVRSIDSWTTVDLTVAYDTGDNRGFLSDTRLALTTQNLFDKDPPFVDTFGGLAYDGANHNPLGRFVALQITKGW